ncbi:MAG: zinc-ribbon domain-containing protein, partial [Caldilineaceae bacterium]
MSESGMTELAGQTNAEEVTCPHCGTRNPIGSNFCNRCGTALGAESAPPRDPAAPMAQAEAIDASLGAVPHADMAGPLAPPVPTEPSDVDAAARAESVVDAADDPTLDALLSAYQPPEDEPQPAAAEPVHFPDEQLLGGGVGYLELVSVSGEMPPPRQDEPQVPSADSEHWRTIRTLLRE